MPACIYSHSSLLFCTQDDFSNELHACQQLMKQNADSHLNWRHTVMMIQFLQSLTNKLHHNSTVALDAQA